MERINAIIKAHATIQFAILDMCKSFPEMKTEDIDELSQALTNTFYQKIGKTYNVDKRLIANEVVKNMLEFSPETVSQVMIASGINPEEISKELCSEFSEKAIEAVAEMARHDKVEQEAES